jgi:hypothetical protein
MDDGTDASDERSASAEDLLLNRGVQFSDISTAVGEIWLILFLENLKLPKDLPISYFRHSICVMEL